jgi:Ca2+-binding EF-hand superfamily protein
MVDYAQRLLSQMSSLGSARTGLVNRVQQKLDSNQDGQLSGAEFQTFFAELQLDPSRASDLTNPSGGSGLHKTLFQCMLYPSFSHNYALAAYQAQEMIKGIDRSQNGQISAAELMSYGQTPTDPSSNPVDPKPQDPPATDPTSNATDTQSLTAQQRAQDLMTQYDTQEKGYIVTDDLTQAWTKDSSLGDPANAQNAIDAWDLNGDNQVSLDEMTTGISAMDQADNIMAAFDPQGTGQIDIAKAQTLKPAGFEQTATRFSDWDVDKNNQLTRQEIILGLERDAGKIAATQPPVPPPAQPQNVDPSLVAASLMAQYDTNKDGGISLDEFTTQAAKDQSITDAKATFANWDENQDGMVTLEELQNGAQQVLQARSIIAQYDLTNKGYFDAADLAAALGPDTNGTQADQIKQIMNFWDVDGNGQVSVAEVMSGIKAGGFVGGAQLNSDAPSTSAPSTSAPNPDQPTSV